MSLDLPPPALSRDFLPPASEGLVAPMPTPLLPPLEKGGWGGFRLSCHPGLDGESPLTPLFQRGENPWEADWHG